MSKLLTNVEIVWKEGLPPNVLIVQVPYVSFWLWCEKYKNKNWRVIIMDPMKTTRRLLWKSIPEMELNQVLDRVLNPAQNLTLSRKTEATFDTLIPLIRSLRKQRNRAKICKTTTKS